VVVVLVVVDGAAVVTAVAMEEGGAPVVVVAVVVGTSVGVVVANVVPVVVEGTRVVGLGGSVVVVLGRCVSGEKAVAQAANEPARSGVATSNQPREERLIPISSLISGALTTTPNAGSLISQTAGPTGRCHGIRPPAAGSWRERPP
jgi:hypothetical protein